jgi:hypothetical protein
MTFLAPAFEADFGDRIRRQNELEKFSTAARRSPGPNTAFPSVRTGKPA